MWASIHGKPKRFDHSEDELTRSIDHQIGFCSALESSKNLTNEESPISGGFLSHRGTPGIIIYL